MEDPQWPRAADWLAGVRPTGADAPLLVVLGVPLSQTSISPSAADTTPAAVRQALERFSTFMARGDGKSVDLETVAAVDLGDIDVGGMDSEAALGLVAAAIAELHDSPMLSRAPDLMIVLGGDNALTRPVMGCAVDDLSTAGLVTLDAHHDVRGWHAGVTNGTPVRGLIEDGLAGASVVQIGIGSFTNSHAYRAYCDGQGISTITAAQARAAGVAETLQQQLDRLALRCDEIYVDIDVDVLDSAFAPGCPGARPGGITPAELHEAAFVAGRHRAVVAIDIVEVDAQADVGGVTVDNAALCLLSAAAGLAVRRS